LAKTLAKKFKVGYSAILFRNRETKTQVGLSREERKKNIKGAFSLSQGANVNGRDFLLVDDVYTSGATIREAAKVLKSSGARNVWAMAVALG